MAIKINNTTIIDDSRNIVNAGVITATSFSGSGVGLTGVSGIASNTSINTSGIVTASSFVGNLTGTASTATAAGTAYGLTGSPNVTVGVLTATTISTGSTTGTAGQVLQSTGTGVTWTAAASGGISVSDSNLIGYNSAGVRNDGANGRLDVFGTGNFRVFTSPGTYVVNPGISSIRVRVVGAGGNGVAYVNPTPRGGGGGGGGGYAHKVITSFTAPRSYAVTVGSAPGGTSSFGSEVSATGGSNASGPTGGSGGTGSDGDVNYTGATGSGSQSSDNGTNRGGSGGAAATQKGNGSGSSVPGLPSLGRQPFTTISGNDITVIPKVIDYTYYSRFPFDIFNGTPGQISGSHPPASNFNASPVDREGYNGGEGHTAFFSSSPSPLAQSGGKGGVGAGGGGGFRANGITQPGGVGGIGGGGGGAGGDTSPGGSGGSGGPGIVIVEW